MAILENELEVSLNSQTIMHYENKGYTIPRWVDTRGVTRVNRNQKIKVLVKDLPPTSQFKLTRVCDFCGDVSKATNNKIQKSRNRFKDGKDRCKSCSNRQNIQEQQKEYIKSNSISVKDPDFAILFWDKDDTLIYTCQSNKRADFKCLNCKNKIHDKRIQDVYKYGLSCPYCSQGASYPERYVANLLSQLGIDFIKEKSFEWSKGRRYDFYLPELNLIIETHGKQHYIKQEWKNGRSFSEETANDNIKKELASKNGISIENYIVIDSRRSSFTHMEKSINNNAKLKLYFDLDKVNHRQCHLSTYNNDDLKTICKMFNDGKSPDEIATQLDMHTKTVRKNLNIGEEIGLTTFVPWRSRWRAVVKMDLDYQFISEYDSLKEAGIKNNVSSSYISTCCKKQEGEAGGFIWRYKEDYEDMDKNKKRDVYRIGRKIPIVQLSKNGEFIKEWDSGKDASDALNVSHSNIVKSCKSKYELTCGCRWMYLQDYNQQVEDQESKENNLLLS